MGDKPTLKVAIKPKDDKEAKPLHLFAAWRDERGRLSGRLDKSITELAVRLEDGKIVRIKRGQDGKETHWINVYDGPPGEAKPKPPKDDGWNDGGDDMPF